MSATSRSVVPMDFGLATPMDFGLLSSSLHDTSASECPFTPSVFRVDSPRESEGISASGKTESPDVFLRHSGSSLSKARTVIEDRQLPLEEQVFANLIHLKIAVSEYAMHLPLLDRGRLYCALDDLLDLDAWHEGDELPRIESFRNFLKWAIYAKDFAWTSLGLSEEGELLVAWRQPNFIATARFGTDTKVRWTTRLESENGTELAAGICSMQHFSHVTRDWQRAIQ